MIDDGNRTSHGPDITPPGGELATQETFECHHCHRVLSVEVMSDAFSLADRYARWCDTCTYITHPDGEGEEECDGSCAEREDRWSRENGWIE